MKTTELPTLPNGLPLYKLMQYKVTGEKCKIIKVSDTLYDAETGQICVPLTVTIKINRITQGIPHTDIIENLSQFDFIVWNESMNPKRSVTYLTRKRQARTVYYGKDN